MLKLKDVIAPYNTPRAKLFPIVYFDRIFIHNIYLFVISGFGFDPHLRVCVRVFTKKVTENMNKILEDIMLYTYYSPG